MSEEKDTPAAAPGTGSGGYSRRDFLRQAGREAVKTGIQASPTNLAKAAVGLSTKTPWWQKLAAWRKDQTEPTTQETEKTDESADAE
ncbi:MAG: hypothetical protein QM758_26840 [Armatimonas sp.]